MALQKLTHNNNKEKEAVRRSERHMQILNIYIYN